MKTCLRILFFLALSIVVQAQTPQELKSFLPNINSWTIKESVEVFTPDNLHERINGSAPLFIENNCKEMTSMEYTHGSEYITVQAYRHAGPTDAFGMYASERSTEIEFIPGIGGEAQGDNISLCFFSGPIYVKMQTNHESPEAGKVMKEIGKQLAGKIQPSANYPDIFQKFPEEGKVTHSESYTTSSYIGHEFLNKVYTCNYKKGNVSFQVFLMERPDKAEIQSVVKQYFNFTKQPQDFVEGKLTIKDKYNGNIPCIWKGRYLVGIFNDAGADMEEDALLEKITSIL